MYTVTDSVRIRVAIDVGLTTAVMGTRPRLSKYWRNQKHGYHLGLSLAVLWIDLGVF